MVDQLDNLSIEIRNALESALAERAVRTPQFENKILAAGIEGSRLRSIGRKILAAKNSVNCEMSLPGYITQLVAVSGVDEQDARDFLGLSENHTWFEIEQLTQLSRNMIDALQLDSEYVRLALVFPTIQNRYATILASPIVCPERNLDWVKKQLGEEIRSAQESDVTAVVDAVTQRIEMVEEFFSR